jgi:hypothetical protein
MVNKRERQKQRIEIMRVKFLKLEAKRPGVVKVRKQKQWKLSKRAQQARKNLPAVKAEFGPLFAEVSAILFRCDPMRINYGFNSDEYDPEVGTILPRLKQCRSVRDVQKVVYEEFEQWFGIPGEQQKYRAPSQEIWSAWQRFKEARR